MKIPVHGRIDTPVVSFPQERGNSFCFKGIIGHGFPYRRQGVYAYSRAVPCGDNDFIVLVKRIASVLQKIIHRVAGGYGRQKPEGMG
jgi:hypothetical protein